MEKIIKNPKDCNEAELESFAKLVAEGGEVASAGLRKRIENAEKLFFIKDGKYVAVGAIKNPNPGYKSRVFEKSEVIKQEKYKYEIGWLYVSKLARGKGYGKILMEEIVNTLSGKACFATTREDNSSMHHLFNKFGFTKIGKPYKSSNGNYSLILYVNP